MNFFEFYTVNLLVSFSDFQSEYLRCDCHLQWIVKWSRDKNVKIQQSTTCGVPKDLKGVPLKGLKKKDLHCGQYSHRVSFECSLSSIASTLGTQMVVDLSVSNIYSRESQTSIHEHITRFKKNFQINDMFKRKTLKTKDVIPNMNTQTNRHPKMFSLTKQRRKEKKQSYS